MGRGDRRREGGILSCEKAVREDLEPWKQDEKDKR